MNRRSGAASGAGMIWASSESNRLVRATVYRRLRSGTSGLSNSCFLFLRRRVPRAQRYGVYYGLGTNTARCFGVFRLGLSLPSRLQDILLPIMPLLHTSAHPGVFGRMPPRISQRLAGVSAWGRVNFKSSPLQVDPVA